MINCFLLLIISSRVCSSWYWPPTRKSITKQQRKRRNTPISLPLRRECLPTQEQNDLDKRLEKKKKLVIKISLDAVRVGGLFMVCILSFFGYIAASKELDIAFVAVLGIKRSATDAFSPFITLLSLIYSIILAQIYDYEFARQGTIQDGLFTETSALQILDAIVETLARRDHAIKRERPRLLAIVQDCAVDLLNSGFSAKNNANRTSLLNQTDRQLLVLVDDLEFYAGDRSAALCRAAGDTVIGLSKARAQRISAVAAALPLVQLLAERAIAGVVLLSFILVDLGAPKLEATLFSIVCGSFFLINSFLQDLSDPFGGSWSVSDTAKCDLEWLVSDISRRLSLSSS